MNELTNTTENAVSTNVASGISISEIEPTELRLTQALTEAVAEGRVQSGVFMAADGSEEVLAERGAELKFVPIGRTMYYIKKNADTGDYLGKEYVNNFDNREYQKGTGIEWTKNHEWVFLTLDQIDQQYPIPYVFSFRSTNEPATAILKKKLLTVEPQDWCNHVFSLCSVPKKKGKNSWYGAKVMYVGEATPDQVEFAKPIARQVYPALVKIQEEGLKAVNEMDNTERRF